MKKGSMIRTKRLLLREITELDAEQIVKWRSQPEVYRYFKNPHALALSEHLEWYRNKYLVDEFMISWMALEDGNRIGVFHARKLNEKTGEVSYLIAPDYQKKGYASESLRHIETWIDIHWGVVCLIAVIHRENTPSIRFIESMGYKDCIYKDGVFKLYRKYMSGNKERC